jgi:hypothetical protein
MDPGMHDTLANVDNFFSKWSCPRSDDTSKFLPLPGGPVTNIDGGNRWP